MTTQHQRLAAVTFSILGGWLAACAGETAQRQAVEEPAKIPITSSSEEAIELYLQARDLADKLKFPDARELYAQAVAKDADFALGHLGLANTATNAQEFFDALGLAVAAAGGASNAERWMILVTQAGADSDPVAQKEHLTKLIEAYPGDERAHLLIANWYNGRQEYDQAIHHFERAIELNPDFSPPYNSLGYAQRAAGDNAAAEAAFKSYIEVLPEEPNPYDSYAELLMKLGRYQESIESYSQALEKDGTFVASYVGIGNNRLFMGQPEEARAQFQRLYDVARDDGQRRQAKFWTAASYLHEGDLEQALATLEERYEIAVATGGEVTQAGDLNLIGNVLLLSADPDGAAEKYAQSVALIEQAEVSDEVKETARRNHLFDQGRVAVHRDDLDEAAAKLEAYLGAVAAKNIPFEVRRGHQLAGMLALHRGDPETALAELAQANQQDPWVLYLQAKACEHAGDAAGMREFAAKTANWNQLNLNLALVKSKAEHLLAEAAES